jgi:inner membrane protein
MAAWSALSMLPDADVVGLALGISYESAFGHRGASHSLLFSAVVGGVAGLVATAVGLPRRRAAILATAVVVSHALLDTLTDGGLGCALFWPFDSTRYFAPWRPIPVSPIGLAFLSPYGAWVAATELILFAPVLFFALRRTTIGAPRRRIARGFLLAVWAIFVWFIGSSHPLRQSLVGWLVRADTEYARGFSESHFSAISAGLTHDAVRRRLGTPLEEWWDYGSERSSGCRLLRLVDDQVAAWPNFDRCTPAGMQAGMTSHDVLQKLGPPARAVWEYSRSRNGGWFHARGVFFNGGVVEETLRRWVPPQP